MPLRSGCTHHIEGQRLADQRIKSKGSGENKVWAIHMKDEDVPSPVLCCKCHRREAFTAAAPPRHQRFGHHKVVVTKSVRDEGSLAVMKMIKGLVGGQGAGSSG